MSFIQETKIVNIAELESATMELQQLTEKLSQDNFALINMEQVDSYHKQIQAHIERLSGQVDRFN